MHELKLYEVQKKYKDKTAVKQVSYTFKHGVYGLLGENGAGKTTLMRLICGVLQPTTGNIYYDGMEIAQMGAEYRRLLGYLPQELGYYDNFTAERFLRYIAALKAMSAECSEQRIQELLELVELQKDKKKKLRTFSGGMLRRVGIAQALLNNPEILVLDEPINGLDPQGIAEVRDMLRSLAQERGLTILISSHILEELSKLCTDFGIIHKGCLIKELSQEQLLQQCEKRLELVLDEPEKAMTVLDRMNIHKYEAVDKTHLYVYERLEDSMLINRELVTAGVLPREMKVNQEELESYFLNLTSA